MFSRARQIAKRKWAAPVLALGLVALILGIASPSISASREAIEYDELEEWIRARLDAESLSPGKYYPPDDDTIAEFRKWKAGR